ncbi:hypothetical protein A9Z54_04910 [Acinetobacter sp. 51m]|nr:hypothetical protein A9Z54_04910 [Acinetobacter sp. 51m]
MPTSNYYIGAVLSGIREGRQITQKEVGEKFNASSSYISGLEHGNNGEINQAILEFYSKLLDVPISDILDLARQYEAEYGNGLYLEMPRDIIKRRLKHQYYRDRFEPRTRTIFKRKIGR